MDSKRWSEIKGLLGEILALEDTKDRSIFLETRCGGDAELRAELEVFLDYEEKTEIFLETPALDLLEGASPERREGEELGPYRLEEVLAQGGMGVVHRASRMDGSYRQQVAVKVLKRGLDTAEVVRRFQRERQILASLSHPNVVRVLDGGSTRDGLPYYVMEYVEGLPIDRYCRERGLDLRARLALFREVCLAAHSAHQELVVHCDLKPSNVLVTADGSPRLVDFGIARLLRTEGEATILPNDSQPVTWGYASPEQIAGEKPTTASDIYSLGALLYRLLADAAPPRTPPDTGLKPSRAPRDEAAPVGTLDRKPLRGDLDSIVAMATAPDPARRYASAAELAEDVERYLEHRPLRARPPGVLYTASRFLRRYPWQSAVAAVVLVVLGFFGFQWQSHLLRADALKIALLEILEVIDPTARQSQSEAAQDVVEVVQAEAANLHPEDRALLFDRIGRTLLRLGQFDNAQRLLEQALALRRKATDPLPLGESLNNLASVLLKKGEIARARSLLEEALPIHQEHGEPGATAEVQENLATALEKAGKHEEAEANFREVLAGKALVFGADSQEYGTTLNNLGKLLNNRGRLQEGIPLLEQALEIRRRILGPKHPTVATALVNLAFARDLAGDAESVISLYQEALVIHRELSGETSVGFAKAETVFGYTLLGLGTSEGLTQAESHLRHAEAVLLQKVGRDDANTVIAQRHLAAGLLALGRPSEALLFTEKALASQPPDWHQDHWRWADLRSVHGAILAELGRYDEAEPLIGNAILKIVEGRGLNSRYAREARARKERLLELRESGG